MQASREHYCINKAVTTKANKEEECDKLLSGEGASCQYYTNVNRLYGISSNPQLKVRLQQLLSKLSCKGLYRPVHVMKHAYMHGPDLHAICELMKAHV